VKYAIRLPANDDLQRNITELWIRPVRRPSHRPVVRFYNKRGTAEQRIKENKQAVAMTRLSRHRFRTSEVRLWLSLIAYNLVNLWRRLAFPHRSGSGH
jgi:DDE family transposase